MARAKKAEKAGGLAGTRGKSQWQQEQRRKGKSRYNGAHRDGLRHQGDDRIKVYGTSIIA